MNSQRSAAHAPSRQEGRSAARPRGCPSWCVQAHGTLRGEEDATHISGELLVRGKSLRLCSTTDPTTLGAEGPYVLVDSDEYTLHEADALIDALTQLVDEGMGLTRREGV